MRWHRNADEGSRRRQRAALSDPAMINRVVADKLRTGQAASITLGELASMTDAGLAGALPSELVRGATRAFLAPSHGLFYRSDFYLGMIDAFLENEPARIATVEAVVSMVDLDERGMIFMDIWAPFWGFFKPSAVVRRAGIRQAPRLRMVEPYGWLATEVQEIFGEGAPVVLTIDDAGNSEATPAEQDAVQELQGRWVCFMDLELEEQ